jgi:ElaB/YqjD/DUF883 family membrane-anchored ribosome-binding protein
MSEEKKHEEMNLTIEELQDRIENVRKYAEDYKSIVEERMKKRPLETSAIIFAAGIILGILIGTATARRS